MELEGGDRSCRYEIIVKGVSWDHGEVHHHCWREDHDRACMVDRVRDPR
jgi:hypothetical protein